MKYADPCVEHAKKAIRQEIRQRRNLITSEQSRKSGKAALKHLLAHPTYFNAKHIACFLSFDGEISTQAIIEQLIIDKTRCYLPKLKPMKPNRLWFLPYTHETKLIPNKLKIPEVDLAVNHAIRISQLDIILMPLVAFDIKGNRLGMGGGYYDATLAHLVGAKEKPLCFGLAFEEQKVDSIPSQPWDYPLDGIFTQKDFYSFEKNTDSTTTAFVAHK
ncbi:5-formyltetrahydrofolate cyclo-ligase [Aliikangiella maris]|uniref:5-formyltetrahydrofolate cyclo-ligase n=2 Tax=Aliikangiella maris TaxID=3162458 RepID=A0ABV2BW29_9GAMM